MPYFISIVGASLRSSYVRLLREHINCQVYLLAIITIPIALVIIWYAPYRRNRIEPDSRKTVLCEWMLQYVHGEVICTVSV